MISFNSQTHYIIFLCLASIALYLGCYSVIHSRDMTKPVDTEKKDNLTRQRSNVIYGHVHMAKTGGTNVNGMFANTFERVCGNKGYSYNFFASNELAKINHHISNKTANTTNSTTQVGRSLTKLNGLIHTPEEIREIGFEDCDFISLETNWKQWGRYFKGGEHHGVPVELHIPCRDRIDHIMSQCNHRHKALKCEASEEVFLQSVVNCTNWLTRFDMGLLDQFHVKCYDFRKQFTNYTQYMSKHLDARRFQSLPYVMRNSNKPRDKTAECIWEKPNLMKKLDKFLLKTYDYYQFCQTCIGGENDILNNW